MGRIAIDTKELYQIYVVERLSLERTAERLGCGRMTVLRRLKESGIPTRPSGRPLKAAAFLKSDAKR